MKMEGRDRAKRSFLLGIVVYETLCSHCVYWDRLHTSVVFG